MYDRYLKFRFDDDPFIISDLNFNKSNDKFDIELERIMNWIEKYHKKRKEDEEFITEREMEI